MRPESLTGALSPRAASHREWCVLPPRPIGATIRRLAHRLALCCPPSTTMQGARHPARTLGCQEGHDVRDFLHGTHSSPRDSLEHGTVQFRVVVLRLLPKAAGCLPVHQTGAAHRSIETTRHAPTNMWLVSNRSATARHKLSAADGTIVSQGRTNLLVFSQNGREQHGTIDCQCTVEVERCTPTPHSSQPHLGDKQREHAWTMFAILQGRCLCCF